MQRLKWFTGVGFRVLESGVEHIGFRAIAGSSNSIVPSKS